MPGWIYHPFAVQTPTRFGEKYRGTLTSSKTIDVALGVSIVSLGASAGRSSLTALHAFDHTSHTPFDMPVTPAQSVVVAAGGMGNAQLLLQPRADGATPVGNESGLAGRFLMEHPHFYGAAESILGSDLSRFTPPRRFGRSVHALIPELSVEREHGLMGCSLNFNHQNQEHEFIRTFARPGMPFYHYQIDVRSEMRPTAANHVFLTGERSRSGDFPSRGAMRLQRGRPPQCGHHAKTSGGIVDRPAAGPRSRQQRRPVPRSHRRWAYHGNDTNGPEPGRFRGGPRLPGPWVRQFVRCRLFGISHGWIRQPHVHDRGVGRPARG